MLEMGVRGRLLGDWHVLAAWMPGLKASFVLTIAMTTLNRAFSPAMCRGGSGALVWSGGSIAFASAAPGRSVTLLVP